MDEKNRKKELHKTYEKAINILDAKFGEFAKVAELSRDDILQGEKDKEILNKLANMRDLSHHRFGGGIGLLRELSNNCLYTDGVSYDLYKNILDRCIELLTNRYINFLQTPQAKTDKPGWLNEINTTINQEWLKETQEFDDQLSKIPSSEVDSFVQQFKQKSKDFFLAALSRKREKEYENLDEATKKRVDDRKKAIQQQEELEKEKRKQMESFQQCTSSQHKELVDRMMLDIKNLRSKHLRIARFGTDNKIVNRIKASVGIAILLLTIGIIVLIFANKMAGVVIISISSSILLAVSGYLIKVYISTKDHSKYTDYGIISNLIKILPNEYNIGNVCDKYKK